MRKINSRSLELLKKLEGFRPMPYRDSGGVLTVGYGHTGDDVEDKVLWTNAACEEALTNDLAKFEQIDHYLTEDVTDNQFGALVILCYNVGLAAVKLSNTLKLVNEGSNPDKEWMGFNKVNGVVNQGLINRRKAELELFHAT